MARRPEWSAVSPKELGDYQREHGYSVKQLAELLGVTSSTIFSWRSGRTAPSTRTQEKIRAVLEKDRSDHPAAREPVPEPADQEKSLASSTTVTGRIIAAFLTSQRKPLDPNEVAPMVRQVSQALR